MAVSVWAWGSWIIAAPVSVSSHSRNAAASPGRASVPAGRGLTIRRRPINWPTWDRHTHRATIGTHSMAFLPPAGITASSAAVAQTGEAQASPMPPPA